MLYRSRQIETTLQVSNELLPYLSTIENLSCSMNDQMLKVALSLEAPDLAVMVKQSVSGCMGLQIDATMPILS